MTTVEESKQLEFTPWQRVSVSGKEFIVCEALDAYPPEELVELRKRNVEPYKYYYIIDQNEVDHNGYNTFRVSSPHLHGAKSYNLDKPDELCIGCSECNEYYSCSSTIKENPETHEPMEGPPDQCEHAKALIAYLTKKKRDSTDKGHEKYVAGWTREFEIRKMDDIEMEYV